MTGKCIISFDCESKWGMADSLSSLHEQKLTENNLILIYKELVNILDYYNFQATFGFVGALTMSPEYFIEKWGDELRNSSMHSKWLEKFFNDANDNNFVGWFCPELLNIVIQSNTPHEVCSHGFTHLTWKSATAESLDIETRGVLDWYKQNNIKPTTFIFPRNQVGNRNFLNNINAKGYRDQPRYLSSSSLIPRLQALISEFNLFPNSQHHKTYKDLIAIPGGFFLNWRSGLRNLIPISYSVRRFKNALNHAAKNNGTINLWSHPHNFITGRKQLILFKKCMLVLKEKVESGEIDVLTQSDFIMEIESVEKTLNRSLDTVSIIIPVFGGTQFLKDLIKAIKLQTYPPSEVIFIISKVEDHEQISLILSLETELNIFIKVIEPSYPGEARNIGAGMASSKWLAFLDVRTLPNPYWLGKMIQTATLHKSQFLGAKMICCADTRYKEYLKAATFGNEPARCLPGSIVLNKAFQSSQGFLNNVRAGEDWEWINRMSKNVTSSWIDHIVISYNGLPSNLNDTASKWLKYSIENSKVKILFKEKFFYVAIFFIFFAIFLYRWNHIISGDNWDVNNPLFVPNLNKIFWLSVISIYFIFRGIIKPLKNNINLSFLLPHRWFLIGVLGILIDIIKAPGRVLGFFSYKKSTYNSSQDL